MLISLNVEKEKNPLISVNLYQRKTDINGSEVYFNVILRKQHILTSLETKSTDWKAIAISVQIIVVVPTKP